VPADLIVAAQASASPPSNAPVDLGTGEDVWPQRSQDIADSFARNGHTPEPLLRTYAHFGTKALEDGRFVWQCNPNVVRGFVVGASRIVPATSQQRRNEILPDVETVTMPGLGHYPREDDTLGLLAIVNRFLKRSRVQS